MATGFGTGFDLSSLDQAISKAQAGLEGLVKQGKMTEQAIVQNFNNMATQGVGNFLSMIEKTNQALESIGKGQSNAEPMKKINESAAQAVNHTTKFMELMAKINNDNASKTRNSAITKVNEELEVAKARLEELRKLLNYYAKGEGKKAIGFGIDTSEYQKEAKSLLFRIDALEREKQHLQANARLRMEVAANKERIANGENQRLRAHDEKVKESAKIASDAAKQENKIWNEQRENERKAYSEKEKMYDRMGRKMRQQTNLDLGKEYELQEQQRKKQEASQEKLAQFAEKSAQKRAEIQKKSDLDEHTRLQKAWEEKQKQQQRELELIASSEDARRKARDAQNAQNAKAATQIDANDEKLEEQQRKRQEKLEEQQRRKQERIQKAEQKAAENAQKAEDKRYDNWHKNKEKEVRATEEFERKKENAKRKVIAKQNKENRAQDPQASIYSARFALDYAKGLEHGAKSINTMNQALQRLRLAQSGLNLNTEEGKQMYNELGVAIKRVETEMKAVSGASDEVKRKHSRLMDTSGQLARAMAAIFSVSAIKGYINKLREVRGEFEMQQRSLQILLQNKDEADKLWEKTIDLAVKSPFRVKELVTYTKQLAAYRVESDKLYDTTKMLADVSAGLGVDMNRLILAFGQVKAANFLRGTELRQFTEAGIPMLDELAKLFTELEGRAVSAGDVFERISKRMVTFGDVEEVFNRITSAGGVFYKMQEEQSKTLAGLYSNLHDSIDIMLNDIGKANDGLLKGSINVAKEFVENWREVAYVLTRIVAVLTAYKLSSAAFALGLKNTTNATLRFNNALTWADAKTIGFTKSQFLLTKALNATKIAANGVKVAFLQIMLPALIIGGIAKLVQMMTKASREAKRLEQDLNAIFNEDTSNLERQSDTFKDLVERLKDVNKGSKEHKNIISQLNSQYGEYLGFIVDEKTTYDQLAVSIDSVTTALTQKAKASSYEKALERMYEDSDKNISNLSSKIEEQLKKGFTRANGIKIIPTEDEIQDILSLIEKKVLETGRKASLYDTMSEYYGETLVTDFQSQLDQAKLVDEYSKVILERKKEEEKILKRINNLYGEGVYSTKEYRDEMEKLNKAKEEELSNEKSRSGREKIEYKYKVEEVRLQGRYEGLDDSAIQKRVDEIQKVSATVADINRKMGEEAGKFGQDAIDRVYITYQDASQGIDAIAEQTAASYKSMQQEIKDQNALKEAGTVHDQKALDNATLMSQVYYRMLEIMGKTDLAKEKGADSKELKRLKEQIRLIRDAAKAYDDMRKLHGKLYADDKIKSEYGAAFSSAGLGDISGYAFGTRQDEQNNLEKLRESAENTKDGVLELNKAIAQVGVNIADADQEILDKELFDSISDIFLNYEISLEMDKLNIPKDMASKLFGFDAIDLDDIRGKVLEEFKMGDKVGLSNEQIYASDEYKNLSKERRDELRKSLEKEEKLQNEHLQENLKKYIEFSRKALSERAKIKVDEINQLREIEKTFTATPLHDIETARTFGVSEEEIARMEAENAEISERNKLLSEYKALAKSSVAENSQQDMKKIEWDEFRSSDVFINMFSDLDKASESLIKKSIERIEEFKKTWKDMPVAAAKEMTKKLNELQLALYDSGRVGRDKRAIEKELNDEIESRGLKGKANTTIGQKNLSESVQGENQAYTELIEKSNQRIELLQIINDLKSENKALDLELLGYNEEYIAGLGLTADVITNSVNANNELIKTDKQNITNLNVKVSSNQKILNLIDKQKTKAAQLGEKWSKTLGMAKDLYKSFQDIAEAANWDFSDELAIFGEMGMSMADAVINAIALSSQLAAVETGAIAAGTALNTALGIVGLIVMATQLVASALNAISKMNQEKRAEQIEEEIEKVEALAKKYEKLEESINNAFSSAKLAQDSIDAQDNLQAQIESMENAISVYEDADYDKLSDEEIEDWESKKEELAELKEQAAELKETVFSIATAGVFDDISSASDGFVDAWLSAFEETEKGMSGLEESFDDMLKTILKKQMSMAIMGPVMEQWEKSLGKYVNDKDTILTAEEAGQWAKEVKDSFGAVNANLQAYAEALESEGISLHGDKENSLSGLSGGISGITEEQADILSAYWNAVRLSTSNIENELYTVSSNILKLLSEDKGDNPIVGQLKEIASYNNKIYTLLDQVLASSGSTSSGTGFRVFAKLID